MTTTDHWVFDGTVITVSTGTHRTIDLISEVIGMLEDIYNDYRLHTDTLAEANRLFVEDDEYELEQLLEELTDELEAVANLHGYTYGTLEGDGAHFLLSPISDVYTLGQWDADGSAY